MSTSSEKLLQIAEDVPELHNSDLLMKVSGLLLSSTSDSSTKTRRTIDDRGADLSLLTFPPKNENLPFIDVVAIVDPLSVGAQKLAPLLLVLQEVSIHNIQNGNFKK